MEATCACGMISRHTSVASFRFSSRCNAIMGVVIAIELGCGRREILRNGLISSRRHQEWHSRFIGSAGARSYFLRFEGWRCVLGMISPAFVRRGAQLVLDRSPMF